MNTDIWLVTHTFDSDHCPFRRFIPGGYGCNLADGAPCTGRNCPALAPGHDTLDLGVPCDECGATDGWVCECSFTPTKAISSPEKTAALLDFYHAVRQANADADSLGVFDSQIVGALDELEHRLEKISNLPVADRRMQSRGVRTPPVQCISQIDGRNAKTRRHT